MDDAANDGYVKGGGKLSGSRTTAAHDLGNVVASDRVVAGVFPLRGEGDVDAGPLEREGDLEPARASGLEHGSTISSVGPG